MSDHQPAEQRAAMAKAQPKRVFSIVWVVPIMALLIGGWLAFKAISEKGPTITITFANAEGLEAGKTRIKHKDVEIGKVEEIRLSDDISQVVVTAVLVKGSEKYLTDKTRFWVVRARVSGGTASGLDTILSGAFIGIDPIMEGKSARSFTGLDVPPVVTHGQPGRHYRLHADRLGSLDVGTPVYYRQIRVGQVVRYKFSDDGQSVDIQIFVEAPHHTRVTENTRFWNASGIDVTLSAEGLKINTESLVSIASGGVGFDIPNGTPPGNEAAADTAFRLYPNQAGIQSKAYTIRRYWVILFDQSVRGLSVGAPVELYGIKVGEVVSLDLEFIADRKNFRVPVLVAIEPERIRGRGETASMSTTEDSTGMLKMLVEERGLRAQLKSGSLLTGQLVVDLDFHPEQSKTTLGYIDGYPVVPTIPGSFQQIQESLERITNRLENVPFEQLGTELQQVFQEIKFTLKRINDVAGTINNETVPEFQATLAALQKTLLEMQGTFGKGSPLNYNANKTIEELTLTLRSLRELASTLEKRPQSIIFGKEKDSSEQKDK
ncbi:MAG: MlaD family protein [Pseudomonadota bacterium]